MSKVMVLGAGMVGSVIAIDLAKDEDFYITVADISESALDKISSEERIETFKADLSDSDTVRKLIADFDLVCGALPSNLGLQTLRTVIDEGINYCDISFMSEDVLALDMHAKEKGVTVVVDCGVAPGMSNMFVGYADSKLDEIHDVRIYVGGIPRARILPWQYKAAFSPADVLEEYTRPVTQIEHGKIVVKKALTDTELVDFPGVGTLEAFNTDGLRSLVQTIKAQNMFEKTMRYPGHIDLIRALSGLGFFSKEKILVDDVEVIPLNFTQKLLFPQWKYEAGEEDLTVMRVIIEGMKVSKKVRFTWNLFDHYNRATNTTSMARTTAFPCSIVARMISNEEFIKPGVNPPEFIGQVPGLLEKVLVALSLRGVVYSSKFEDMGLL